MKILSVDSLDDQHLDDFHQLTDVALRAVSEPKTGIYIAESLKVLERALHAGHRPKAVLTSDKWLPALHELDQKFSVECAHLPVFVGEPEFLEGLTGYHVHRGTLASVYRPSLPAIDDILRGASRVVVLEDIVDHTNVGAIFRSVAGIGADAVIVSASCADPLYRRSMRVSMGTVVQVPWTRAHSWDSLQQALHAHKFEILAFALSGNAVSLEDIARLSPSKAALVFGSEGDGLSNHVLEGADHVVTIPMRWGVDSLNVAAASAVAMWALRPSESSATHLEDPR